VLNRDSYVALLVATYAGVHGWTQDQVHLTTKPNLR